MLYDDDAPLKIIQARLGHADERTTAKCYIHLDRKQQQEAAEGASHLLDGQDHQN
jgi:integrase